MIEQKCICIVKNEHGDITAVAVPVSGTEYKWLTDVSSLKEASTLDLFGGLWIGDGSCGLLPYKIGYLPFFTKVDFEVMNE